MFLADGLHAVEEEGSPPAREGVERQLWHHLSAGPSILAGVLHPSQLTLARPRPSKSLGVLVRGTETVLTHAAGWWESRGGEATGHHGLSDRLECVQVQGLCHGNISPFLPPSLLPPNAPAPCS